jgi:hypothetical protein
LGALYTASTMATATPVLQAPYVQPAYPQAVYIQAPPSSESSFGKTAETGLAMGGRIYSVMGAVVGIIIMLIMVIIGFTKLRDKHTASAPMTVTSVTACSQRTTSDGQGNSTSDYVCGVAVSFTIGGKTYASPQPINVSSPVPLVAGNVITLRYDPSNPTDITQEASPRTTGWMLIGGGVALGALSVGIAVLTFKSKGLATTFDDWRRGLVSLAMSDEKKESRMLAFSGDDLTAMLAILASPAPIHAEDAQPARLHVEHCLHQMVRFAHLAAGGAPFRGAQWGLNLGRAQEILRSRGGLRAWWSAFEPFLLREDWAGLEALTRDYIAALRLKPPSEEFISRK